MAELFRRLTDDIEIARSPLKCVETEMGQPGRVTAYVPAPQATKDAKLGAMLRRLLSHWYVEHYDDDEGECWHVRHLSGRRIGYGRTPDEALADALKEAGNG